MHVNYDFPYPSQRMPTMAGQVVATSQPLAAQAGLQMLQQGGNAVDAAIATAITLTVVEPTRNGIGSDAFAIVWDGSELQGLNASGRSPKRLDPSKFAGLTKMPKLGWDAVTVPGAVSAWVELSARYGRLPFEALFEPAIGYATHGFPVSVITAASWADAAPIYEGMDEFNRVFLPMGRAPRPGEIFRCPEHAETLERIAESRGEAFYRGSIAERIVADARANGSALAEDDLAEHRADWCGTISQTYRDIELHELPPNGQGLAALMMLGILEHHPLADAPVDSADSLHLQIEAMKLAFADVYRYVADPSSMQMSVDRLLSSDYLEARSKLIDRKEARVPSYGVPDPGGTVYLTTADAQGMMVSFIQSNYFGFGSGVVVPNTGISLQNRGSGFSLDAGHPNRIAAGKRPFHTIIPGFVTQQGLPLMSFGIVGGPMQPQGHAQLIVRMKDYGQNPQTALDAPRWRVMGGNRVALEKAIPDAVATELEARGHVIDRSLTKGYIGFGSGQIILKSEGGYVAGSDPRKEGQAVGL